MITNRDHYGGVIAFCDDQCNIFIVSHSSTELTIDTGLEVVMKEIKAELYKLVKIRAAMHQAPPANCILNELGALNPATGSNKTVAITVCTEVNM